VVLKSDRGTAKLGTHVCGSEDEVARCFQGISRLGAYDGAGRGVLCQEYLEGDEYAFDGRVRAGGDCCFGLLEAYSLGDTPSLFAFLTHRILRCGSDCLPILYPVLSRT
jgi:hypothetical protein